MVSRSPVSVIPSIRLSTSLLLLTSLIAAPSLLAREIPVEAGGTPSGSPSPTASPSPQSGTPTAQKPRFSCQTVSGQYTVFYHPQSQPDQRYAWATPGQLGGGWTPERRCMEISRRLEFYRPDGLLELKTSRENNYDTVCVTTQKVSGCRIVFTVPPGQDPQVTRDRVFQNLTIADSGQQTQGVVTYTGTGINRSGNEIIDQLGQVLNGGLSPAGGVQSLNRSSIFLRPFLDAADGGTGAYLRGGNAVTPGRRLNPEQFR